MYPEKQKNKLKITMQLAAQAFIQDVNQRPDETIDRLCVRM